MPQNSFDFTIREMFENIIKATQNPSIQHTITYELVWIFEYNYNPNHKYYKSCLTIEFYEFYEFYEFWFFMVFKLFTFLQLFVCKPLEKFKTWFSKFSKQQNNWNTRTFYNFSHFYNFYNFYNFLIFVVLIYIWIVTALLLIWKNIWYQKLK